MKVAFGTYKHAFHKHYCFNIAEEVEKRGGVCYYPKRGVHIGADFTIQPDHGYPRLGGRGVFINHGLVNWPQNAFFGHLRDIEMIQKNVDFIIVPSEGWIEWYASLYEKPIHVAGYPRLDKLFGNLDPDGTAIYAPTHDHKINVYSGWNIENMKKICLKMGFKKFVYRQHPAFTKNKVPLNECFRRASIFISDYSSVGLEAIALKIPTILIGNEKWRYENPHISHQASTKAGIRIYNWQEFTDALEKFKDYEYKMKEREFWSEKLCDYQGTSAKRIVDLMETI